MAVLKKPGLKSSFPWRRLAHTWPLTFRNRLCNFDYVDSF